MNNHDLNKKMASISSRFSELGTASDVVFGAVGSKIFEHMLSNPIPAVSNHLSQYGDTVVAVGSGGIAVAGAVVGLYSYLVLKKYFSSEERQKRSQIKEAKQSVERGVVIENDIVKPAILDKEQAKALFEKVDAEAKKFTQDLWSQGASSFDSQAVIDKGLSSLKRMADSGDSSAQFNLGRMYQSGTCIDKDLDEAHRLFVQSASQNNPSAMFALSEMYLDGTGVDFDHEKGTALLERACKGDSAEALHRMGWNAENNQYCMSGSRVDIAERCYERASELGSAGAQIKLERLREDLESGAGESASLSVLREQSANGNSQASYDLGFAHYTGIGAKHDVGRSMVYLNKAHSQNHPAATALLGQIYLHNGYLKDIPRLSRGDEFEFDEAKGLELTIKAAKQNDNSAIAMLNAVKENRDCNYTGESQSKAALALESIQDSTVFAAVNSADLNVWERDSAVREALGLSHWDDLDFKTSLNSKLSAFDAFYESSGYAKAGTQYTSLAAEDEQNNLRDTANMGGPRL